jgi:hypothetical protein
VISWGFLSCWLLGLGYWAFTRCHLGIPVDPPPPPTVGYLKKIGDVAYNLAKNCIISTLLFTKR